MLTGNSTDESTTTTSNNKEELLAIRVIGSRTYFLIQNGSSNPKWQPISSAPSHASKFISYLSTKFDALQLQQEIDSLRRQHLRKPPPDPWQFCVGRKIHEVRFDPKCEPQYLLSHDNPYIGPKWVNIESLPKSVVASFLRISKMNT